MKTASRPVATRILAGLIFFVFGLKGSLLFLLRPSAPGHAGAFAGAIAPPPLLSRAQLSSAAEESTSGRAAGA